MSKYGAIDSRGAALVEMAIMLPLMLVLVFGIFEMGRVLYLQQKLSDTAIATSQYMSRAYEAVNSDCTEGSNWGASKSAATTQAENAINATEKVKFSGLTVTIPDPPLPTPTGSPSGVCVVSVAITLQFDGLFGSTLIPLTDIGPVNLNASAESVYLGE